MECELMKGITIDRTYHSVPQLPNFDSKDVALIKSMGFDFIKLVINPAVHKSGNTVVNMDYINSIVDKVISQDMHTVLCIHPESSFKKLVFQDKKEFRDLCQWYERVAGQLSQKWSDKDLVFQLMTEPFGTSPDPDAWNCWNKLQPPMWQAVRQAMPNHTLILSGDQVGRIEGLIQVEPVHDKNVMYGFSHYEPFIFTLQGASWAAEEFGMYMPCVQHVPYPSNPDIIELALPDILRDIPSDLYDKARLDVEAYGDKCWNKKRMIERIRMLADWSQSYGDVKLFCGEFGCLHKTVHLQHRYQFINDFRKVLEEYSIPWSYWSFNETFTVLRNGQRDKQMLEALFN